jgi:UDP-N-acetylmuramoyl-tripeptide--D-alanyl-D-alanine ligase
VNDHLPPGTEVLVAEMGIYGPGEIRDMCEWVPPDIAVITAIGPVHLERMGSEENILAAKAEITERAATVVLNADDQRLAHLALSPQLAGKKVVLASARDAHAAAAATPGESGLDVAVSGRPLLTGLDTDAPPTNIAVAVAVALELGVPPEVIAERLPSLPQAENRLDRTQGAGGFTILDDTFNSNPAGARRALDALASVRQEGRRAVVVTPGMVELGPRQHGENAAFAEAAGAVATDLVVVGHTNRRALLAGAARAGLEPVLVADRQAAVAWVKANLGPGDAVLYENDLPDHWP